MRYDAIVVGGGPAGSTCAWRLHRAGLRVAVVDRSQFPRDKVCAGWITPQVVRTLELDLADYAKCATLQPIEAFGVGRIGHGRTVTVSYGTVVSYGIRRCEFDAYLLRRCGAKRLLGIPVTRIEQTGGNWIVNGQLQAPVLVGAGGHFCPVARLLGRKRRGRVVVAREFEVVTHLPTDAPEWGDQAGPPQLYFSDDLLGYGWVFPKGNCVNVGLGRFGERRLTEATERFAEWLRREGRIPPDVANRGRWHGHAYAVSDANGVREREAVPADGVLLVGDALGLAYAESGEGIRPAVESGWLAAEAILSAAGRYSRSRLSTYATAVATRFDLHPRTAPADGGGPGRAARAAAGTLLSIPWFVRHVVMDRWFLRATQPALV